MNETISAPNRPLNGVNWASPKLWQVAAVVLIMVTWMAIGLCWLKLVSVGWQQGIRHRVVVGMTRDDVIDRMGPPDAKHTSGSEAWRRGFTHLTRPISGELLIWTLYDPGHAAYRLFVYIGQNGEVECVYLGST